MKQHFGLSHLPCREATIIPCILLGIVIGGLTSCGSLPRRYVIQGSSGLNGSEKLDINSAGATELEAVPGIGKSLARRIVAHREKHGKFQQIEHLLMVRGISERKLKQISSALTAQ